MFFKQFFDPRLAQYAYMIGCQKTGEAVVIDPMRDIRPYLEVAEKEKLRITAAADTHIHADYISGLREFAERGVKVYGSDEGDKDWKYEWLMGSSYSYHLLKDEDVLTIGNIEIKALHTPGHTPEHLMFAVTDKGGGADTPMGVITGDFVFVGDVGRPDLLESAAGMKDVMKPSAKVLYQSLQKFRELPEFMKVWPGHGAGSACGKALGAVPDSTVGYELRFNQSLAHATSEDDFVDFILEGQPEPPLYFARMKRDNKLGPKVLGTLPEPKKMAADELAHMAGSLDVAVIDTRSREAFMNGHLEGALFSPMDKQFNTTAGSYVTEDQPIYLVIDEGDVEEAVTALIHVGLDDIRGYIPVHEYEKWIAENKAAQSIVHTNFKEAEEALKSGHEYVLDVRKASEFSEGHIEGALNIPHTRLLERIDEVKPDGNAVYVHCSAGGRSAVAAALVQRYGHDVVYIDGEYASWNGG
ncbi:rhodanese-like domain-containing protein [Balneolaceae bacterium ANBcel3]|nr:rhodanese-like domain-containing protein [Balneolaceae bacterium ANBcel3]